MYINVKLLDDNISVQTEGQIQIRVIILDPASYNRTRTDPQHCCRDTVYLIQLSAPVRFSLRSVGMNSFQKAHDEARGPSPVPFQTQQGPTQVLAKAKTTKKQLISSLIHRSIICIYKIQS